MAVILRKLVQLYNFLNDEIAEPGTKDWFLMGSPLPGLTILGVYLYTVLKLGPQLMENRKPFSLKYTLIAFNVIQIVACFYTVYQGITLAWGNKYRLVCEPVGDFNNPLVVDIAWKFCYGYFVIKLVDLLDTVFFVMRKKQKQVSFLHVYHHTGMVCLSWGFVKWLPGGHGSFLIILNSSVHIVMYFYYLLTAYDEEYKKSSWWKKYVTQIQIIQFGMILLHFTTVFFVENCSYPKIPSIILIPQNLFMIILFSDFYRKAYLVKKPIKSD